jgi:hypothetical protein
MRLDNEYDTPFAVSENAWLDDAPAKQVSEITARGLAVDNTETGCLAQQDGSRSGGYWHETRAHRTEAFREEERKQQTRFGDYWCPQRPRPRPTMETRGRVHPVPYTARRSPYDPTPGYPGITGSQPRNDPVTEAAFRAECAKEPKRPLPPPPFAIKQAQQLAWLVLGLRFSNDPYSYQRLRDNAAHEAERNRHDGIRFWDKENPTPEQFAHGVRSLELASMAQCRRRRGGMLNSLRQYIDLPANDESASSDEASGGDGYDPLASNIGFYFENITSAIEERRARYNKPLRPRRMPGRKPIGERAMTSAERKRRSRAKKKKNKRKKVSVRLPTARERGDDVSPSPP